jgi:tRNA A-37 threonylcarbamoyl transferase component Bud32
VNPGLRIKDNYMPSINDFKSFKLKNGWKISVYNTRANHELMNQVQQFVTSYEPLKSWIRIKSSGNSRIWKLSGNNRSYIFKEYLRRSFLEYPKTVLNGSRARKSLREGLNLMNKGFLTPEMQAFGEKTFLGIPTKNFIITTLIPEAIGIYSLLKDSFKTPLSARKIQIKRNLLSALGKTVGRLHSAGIVHGDLRLDNIIVIRWDERNPDFYFIDNERNSFFTHGIPERLRLKNLVQINMIVIPQITFSDRLRFFRAYLSENQELQQDAKQWMRNVFMKTRERLQDNFPGVWIRF